jgi:hypothetical protein
MTYAKENFSFEKNSFRQKPILGKKPLLKYRMTLF